MCERRAKTLKRDLPKQFWIKLPEWKSYFFYQLSLARRLTAQYPEKSIYRAIHELKYIYSLKIKKLRDLIETYERQPKIDLECEIPEILPNSTGRFERPKSKLEELDE